MDAGTATPQEPATLDLVEGADGSYTVSGLPPAEGEVETRPAEPTPRAEGDDDDDDDDERTHSTGTQTALDASAAANETDEEKRERRRQERVQKKQRAREREDQMRQELAAQRELNNQLMRRLDVIENRGRGTELEAVAARLAETRNGLAYLRNVIADGTKAQNGEAVAEATEQLQRHLLAEAQLTRLHDALAERSARPQPAVPDPRLVAHANAWMGRNRWYNPKNPDVDTQEVLLIDRRLAQEGFDPTTPEYWTELDKRVKDRLPHRGASGVGTGGQSDTSRQSSGGYNPPASQGKPSRSVTAGSGSGGAAPSSGAQRGFVLSAERVQALKDAGTWDDPKARADAIRRYREYDAQQRSA